MWHITKGKSRGWWFWNVDTKCDYSFQSLDRGLLHVRSRGEKVVYRGPFSFLAAMEIAKENPAGPGALAVRRSGDDVWIVYYDPTGRGLYRTVQRSRAQNEMGAVYGVSWEDIVARDWKVVTS